MISYSLLAWTVPSCAVDLSSRDRHCCQNRQQCRSNIRLCRKNRSTCSIQQCCFDVVAVVDGALSSQQCQNITDWNSTQWLSTSNLTSLFLRLPPEGAGLCARSPTLGLLWIVWTNAFYWWNAFSWFKYKFMRESRRRKLKKCFHSFSYRPVFTNCRSLLASCSSHAIIINFLSKTPSCWR